MSLISKSLLILLLAYFAKVYPGFGQNLPLADSLESVYLGEAYQVDDELNILQQLCESVTDPDKKVLYSDQLITRARQLNSGDYEIVGLLELGNALRLKSDLRSALENYFAAAKIASEFQYQKQLGAIYVAIADVYSVMEDHDNAVEYYNEAIDLLRHESDSVNLASALLNLGDEYFNINRLDSALKYFQESGKLFEQLDYTMGVAYNLGNVGLAYAQMGLNISAEDNINKAIQLLTEVGDYYPISVYLTYMSDIYLEKNETSKALEYAHKSLDLAKEHGLREQIRDANLKLSEVYGSLGKTENELSYFQDYVSYKDSINNVETVQQLANLRTDYEVSQKQIEVDLLNQRQENQRIVLIATVSIAGLILLIAFGLAHRYRYIRRTSKIIENEKDRSDKLLLNILPVDTAEELKSNGKVTAKKFDSATVLFTDFKEFTRTAESLSPEQLVASIDYYFKAFDEITSKYGLEKIKTIGDSYMCAGGVPAVSGDHALRIVRAAVEMLQFTEQQNANNDDLAKYEVRIGIHTGPVIAGIVGHRKWQYDIWGDTVNIASRMESNSMPGKINISETTYEEVKDQFNCVYRGEIEAKNRGELKMYFLDGLIMEPSSVGISSKSAN